MHHNVLSEDVKYTASYIKELCFVRDGSHTCDVLSDTDVKSIIGMLCCRKYIFVSYVDMHFIDMFLHLNNCTTTKCEINAYYYYYIIIIIV